ncbi:signal recognition particle subunit Srp21 [Schizosaccharomyces japonicus yFS275]|uniref:Signal recognition particle subunit Srp21 n=1 Tax=Schizosaccharomyces japonicus (strain yFS275 / FY16936) TaxID=402676 RepID=B6K458_SCHJY|nr:signal recognition particle subunit Srp21 [Schizosaccharomyces japonicus yFS275]EEB08265.1 signal recognition particle subunit Srp21 [Schizosaccharomyces japonicus yFS275]
MVVFRTLNEFLEETKLLLDAYPSTTKLVIRYRIHEADAYIFVKAYEIANGICLKYRTDKLAEMTHLIQMQGKFAFVMNGKDIPVEEEAKPQEVQAQVTEKPAVQKAQSSTKSQKKKKRGKRK